METVTYLGPDGYFVARDGDEKVKLPKGSPVEVNEHVSDELLEVVGHDFEVGPASAIPADASADGPSGSAPSLADSDAVGAPDPDNDPSGSTN